MKRKCENHVWSFFDKFFGVPFWNLSLAFLILSTLILFEICF